MALIPGKRLAVFAVKSGRNGTIWSRAGTAFVNPDDSLNVVLDVLPMDGRLHVREAGERRDAAPNPSPALEQQPLEAAGEHH